MGLPFPVFPYLLEERVNTMFLFQTADLYPIKNGEIKK